jgi:2,3-bisphosphoglycerate-independent phosphoglycerate mutase
MKFCVVIMDGASGWPLPSRGGRTCLELAATPNLDRMAAEGYMGTSLTVPPGMEPGSAPACMSVMGYDPVVYYKGRSAIEARSMGVPIEPGEVAFRCNFVTVAEGKMASYSAGHITTEEAGQLIAALNEKLGSESVRFFPGVNYRHICKIKGRQEALGAICTPPHDISGKAVEGYLPAGEGSEYLRQLMKRSEAALEKHPVNVAREKAGKQPATTIWLFWASGQIPGMPPFDQAYGMKAALTSGVDLLRGLGMMAGMEILNIKGVNDQLDNDYAAQVNGALEALKTSGLVIVHIEAPDEMGHKGSIDEKIKAIEYIDSEVIGRLSKWQGGDMKVLVMPDHPTPIEIKTHYAEPVPFLIWGKGVIPNGGRRFTEKEAKKTGSAVDPGYKTMELFIKG